MRFFTTGLKGKKNMIGAEIGVASGGHAKEILDGLDMKLLYLVDSYGIGTEHEEGMSQEMYDNFKTRAFENLASYPKDKYKWLLMSSYRASRKVKDRELDFVYIDANHDFDYVVVDIKAWRPKVKSGGMMAGHDWNNSYVKMAIIEVFGSDNIIHDETDWYVKV